MIHRRTHEGEIRSKSRDSAAPCPILWNVPVTGKTTFAIAYLKVCAAAANILVVREAPARRKVGRRFGQSPGLQVLYLRLLGG